MDTRIEKLNFLGKYLGSSPSSGETLEMAMLISQDVLGYDHAMIRLVEGDILRAVKWIGFPREAAGLEIKLGEGISGEAAQTGESILVEDTLADERFLSGVEGCRSELCVPLCHNQKTIGVFNVESDQPAYFTGEDRQILETFASQIAGALETNRLRDQLLQAEKLSAVGSFASSILHDIRNDIHRLNITSDMLKNSPGDAARIEMLAGFVKNASDNIYGMIEETLDFVKTGQAELKIERYSLADFLESVAKSIETFAPENITVNLSLACSATVSLDERRMTRALLNLARNAIDAMPDGGELTIAGKTDGEAAIIEIRDQGVGIEPDRLEKIWEPFYTDGKTNGTGLGMAIVKKAVTGHGWSINADSTPGQGTVFTITTGKPGA